MIAVTVTFTIKSGLLAQFLTPMIANAKASLELEAGCHQFDVCTDPERPNEVFLYEIYTDSSAFEVHLKSEHFKLFEATAGQFIEHKAIKIYNNVAN